MKKLISLLTVTVLLLSLAAFAQADALRVVSPSGAPGIALAAMAVEDPDNCAYVAADAITAEFASGASDFIIAPLNAGAKLFRAGKSTYRLAAVVTWGNLYFASQREGFSAETINGSPVTLFGENTINASIALYALKENGIVPSEISYLAGAANTQSLLLSDPEAIVLTAEPALTAAGIKNSAVRSVSVNELYKNATGFEGYTQAGLFVKAETAENKKAEVDAFLKKAQEACSLCETDVETVANAAVKLEILPNAKVALSAVPRCAIRFVYAAEARSQVEATAAVDLSQFGGALPEDDFYYAAE